MTLRHLKIFVSVYQNMSITKAADDLHLAQPSVSLAIKELESNYHMKLFDRISRKIYPTQAGTRFYGYAIHIITLFDEMETDCKNWGKQQTIRIGSSITIGNFLIPTLVKDFQKIYPEVKIQVFIKNTETIETYILNNKVDFALIEGTTTYEQISIIPFLDDRLCLIVNPAHPLTHQTCVTINDIAPYPFLLREPGSAGRDIIDSIFNAHQITVVPTWESVSTQALVQGVINDIGISILPYLLVKKYIEKQEVIEIPVIDLNFSRYFSIIYHKNKYLTDACLAFIELCKHWSK